MAHIYKANVVWERGEQTFTDKKYSRGHHWHFDGGVVVPASSSPLVVKLPLSREDAVDPEEAFIAAISSCHMLFFLDFASRAGFCIDRYADAADGVMDKGTDSKIAMTKVTLRPKITWSGEKQPAASDIADLHHKSHEHCFIANSVKTEVVIEH
jgi:organic hydroperoxide reductase OsmC/OhrA